MKKFLKNELAGWKKFEVLWLTLASVIILGVSIYFEEEIINKVKFEKQPIVIKTSHFSRVGYDAFKKDACKKL